MLGTIAVKGKPAPIQAGKRWPVERTHSWMNGPGMTRSLPSNGRHRSHRRARCATGCAGSSDELVEDQIDQKPDEESHTA
jgi:hypothetical protein